MQDVSGVLAHIQCFFLDMDGTVYLGNRLINGTMEFLDAVRRTGRKIIFLTNNSSKSGRMYIQKLNQLGISVASDELLTSGQAAADILKREYPGKKIWLLGNHALREELIQYGLPITDTDPDVVLTAFDTELSYQKLWDCCNYVRAGLPYLATHPDINCPTENGFMPDLGSVTALIHASTNRYPDRIIGKPHRDIFECAARITAVPVSQCAICGDRLYTDIAAGKKQGIFSILVLTGETNRCDLMHSSIQPDLVVNRLSDCIPYLQ